MFNWVAQIRERYFARVRVGYARMGAKLEELIRGTSPVRSHKMQQNSRVFPRGEFRLQTLIDTEYASFVREGTRPHPISPIKGRKGRNGGRAMLRFEGRDGITFRRTVNHPGTKPNSWYDDALEDRIRLFEMERAKLP